MDELTRAPTLTDVMDDSVGQVLGRAGLGCLRLTESRYRTVVRVAGGLKLEIGDDLLCIQVLAALQRELRCGELGLGRGYCRLSLPV